jgi:hypothetical protein
MRTLSLALAGAIIVALTASAARADLVFANPAVNVGEVRCGAPLKQKFAFTNSGTVAVEITGLQTSCGCLKPHLETRNYLPDDSGELTLEIHTLSQSAGEHTWRLQVAYRIGTETREAELAVQGRIVTELTVQPAALTVFTERAASHDIVLTDLRKRPLTVTGINASSPHLSATVKQTATDAAGHRVVTISLALNAACPDGRHEETIAILTDDAEYRELTVPVTLVKRSRQGVTASPAAVSLAASAGQPVPSRIVLLRPAAGAAVLVDSIEADDTAVACTWAAGPNECATLKVTIDHAKLTASGLRSAIHVHISKPTSETITIPVMCLVQ